MKRNLERLPISGYPPYLDDSRRLAFVIPIFRLSRASQWVKSSIAVATSLVANTNVIQNRIPIYFLVENDVYENHWQDFMTANISQNRILTFNPFNSDILINRVSLKLMALMQSALDQYDCYCIIDADLFACCNPELQQQIDVTLLEGDRLGCLWFEKEVKDKQEMIETSLRYCKYGRDWTMDKADIADFEQSEAALRSVYPNFSMKMDRLYDNLKAGIIRLPNPLPHRFKEFCLKLESKLGDDELILLLYTTFFGGETETFEGHHVKVAYRPEKMMQIRETAPYWAHLWNEDLDVQDWEKTHWLDAGLI